jgi:hypothetical protein
MVERVNSSVIYLIYCKNLCKWDNVPPHGPAIKIACKKEENVSLVKIWVMYMIYLHVLSSIFYFNILWYQINWLNNYFPRTKIYCRISLWELSVSTSFHKIIMQFKFNRTTKFSTQKFFNSNSSARSCFDKYHIFSNSQCSHTSVFLFDMTNWNIFFYSLSKIVIFDSFPSSVK